MITHDIYNNYVSSFSIYTVVVSNHYTYIWLITLGSNLMFQNLDGEDFRLVMVALES